MSEQDSAKSRLEGISLLLAIEEASRERTVISLLFEASEACLRAEDPEFQRLGRHLRDLQVPRAGDRLARALGVEPEEFDYYDPNDHVRDLYAFRKARGLHVPDEDEDAYEEGPPFEHPSDLLAILREK